MTEARVKLKEEAQAIVDYALCMSKVAKNMPQQTFQKIRESSAPGMDALLRDARTLLKQNPDFESSLAVAIFRSAVAKGVHGRNAQIEEKCTNFVRVLGTYDKMAAEVLSANIGGPGERWIRRMNAKEREASILKCGENNELVDKRMEKAMALCPGSTFTLAIDATKSVEALEVSQGYKAIV